ncbi:EF-hand [Decorospora gaudefroyi]|uniref:EF-hand n=1 Tax=Decorospora gaudefroyi TaxID=184978 RepID=A0A6A5K2B6_9PLEO|nr:EF-hand [Decorospora gaudefroyi]
MTHDVAVAGVGKARPRRQHKHACSHHRTPTSAVMSTTPTPYKPSPLSFNSPRQSPFRRPGSIRESSPSTLRPTTPSSSPLKPKETPTTPSQANLRQSTASNASQNPPSWLSTRGRTNTPEPPSSPTRNISPTRHVSSSTQNTVRPLNTASIAAKFDGAGRDDTPPPLSIRKPSPPVENPSPAEKPVERLAARPAPMQRMASSDALSKLPPPLLHSMRESFSVMDRDDDGHVNSADVADILSQLGLSATPSQLSAYFNGAQSINLATYLTTLSDLLGNLSQQNELSAAFEAFDDGDDGQIDLSELKDALLHTTPEPGEKKLTEREIDMVVEGFSGRRAFGKGGKRLGRGEVFRYQEFMSNLTGGGNNGENAEGAAAPA